MFVGRTFDDFLLRPRESVVASRRSVSVAGRLTRALVVKAMTAPASDELVRLAAEARELELERSHLYKKMRALGIERDSANEG